MRRNEDEKEAPPGSADAQPPAASSSHRNMLQKSGLAADPDLAGSARGGKRKWTANRKTTITNDIARDEGACYLRKAENKEARGKKTAPKSHFSRSPIPAAGEPDRPTTTTEFKQTAACGWMYRGRTL